jgi:hypothetical protein
MTAFLNGTSPKTLAQFHHCGTGHLHVLLSQAFCPKIRRPKQEALTHGNRHHHHLSDIGCLFSGMEIAFVSSNKIYLEIEKKQDNFLSGILTKLTEKPSQFIVSMLIGNTIVLVVYGFFMGELIMNWFVGLGYGLNGVSNVLIQTTISTVVVLITSSLSPKCFSRFMPIA